MVWKAAGGPPSYASCIVGTFGGVRQIVGYDAVSLGGWDVATGARLWKLVPPEAGDYNVPTPIAIDGKLLVTTENNGTRLYAFDGTGRIVPEPRAWNEDLASDTCTPVVLGRRACGVSMTGELLCLDTSQDLKTVFALKDAAFKDHVSLIGYGDRLLVTSVGGELVLVSVGAGAGGVLVIATHCPSWATTPAAQPDGRSSTMRRAVSSR